MATTTTVALRNVQGTQVTPAVVVPPGTVNIRLEFDGSTLLDPAVHLDALIEYAPDGVTWQGVFAGTLWFGTFDRSGQPRATYTINADLPQPLGPTPKVRATATPSAPVSTVLTITTSP